MNTPKKGTNHYNHSNYWKRWKHWEDLRDDIISGLIVLCFIGMLYIFYMAFGG